MKKIIGVFIVLSITAFTTTHKFYSSISQINYNETSQSLEILSRYTAEDIELVLQKRYDTAIAIDQDKNNTSWKTYLKQYCNEKFVIHIDDQQIPSQLIAVNFEDDLLLCHFKAANISNFESIQISNTILMDFFEAQQNIVHVKKGNQRKTLILEKENHKGLLKFAK